MPQFELPVAITLVVGAILSAGFRIFAKADEGKIKLPTTFQCNEGEPLNDPFDVTKAEDMVDGEPINEERFWAMMRVRKVFLTIIFSVIFALQWVRVGWTIARDDPTDLAAQILFAVFALYLVAFTIVAVQARGRLHSLAVIHLAALTFISTSSLVVISILPPVKYTAQASSAPRALWYIIVAFYLIASVLSWTIPRGPPLHYPSDKIYSEKIMSSVTSNYHDNVCGVVGASVWDTFLFSYTTKVVMLGYTSESLEIGDLPIVPGDMRATTIYATMKQAMRRWKLRIGSWRPTPGSGWNLIYVLVRNNSAVLVIMTSLAAVAAVLFYAPAFFLQRIVRYIEDDPTRSDRGWGWVYSAALFLFLAISQLINGQLWSLSTTTMQVRLRVQLNSVLFAKTLVRKDVASSSSTPNTAAPTPDPATPTNGSAATSLHEPEVKKKDSEDDFSSKAQVMTLMTTDVDRVSEFAWHLFTIVDSPIEIVVGTI